MHKADAVFIDLGFNLGALNRVALLLADCVITPVGPDLFSVPRLKILGPRLRLWRRDWTDGLDKSPTKVTKTSEGKMTPLGYIIMQHCAKNQNPMQLDYKWVRRIPAAFREYVLDDPKAPTNELDADRNHIATLRNYRSLMPMAQDARKPIFALKPADGALGSNAAAVHDAYEDYKRLSLAIVSKAGIQEKS